MSVHPRLRAQAVRARKSIHGSLASLAVAATACCSLAGAGPAQGAEITAKSADAFVDTIGVVLHVSYTRTPYWSRWTDVKAALLALGVRHYRDGVMDCTAAAAKAFCRHYEELAGAGLTGDFVASLNVPMSVVTAFPGEVPGAVASFEGPNEVDINGDPNWQADVAAYQQLLYSSVKNDPATAKYPVIGPAMGHLSNYALTNDLSASFDYGSLHNYLGPINPGTVSDGRIARWVQSARTLNSAKRDVTTETGYWDGPAGKGLPDAVIARYEPRLFLEQFESGIVKTYQYEFLDEGTDLAGIYTHAGLLAADLTPKPQYYALQSLIGLLKDPGPAFTPRSLDYELGGNTDHLDHRLFAKRDGSMYLALWLEKPSYDIREGRMIDVPPQQIELTVRGATAGAVMYTFDDAGHVAGNQLPFNGQSAALAVGDHLVIVRLPAGS